MEILRDPIDREMVRSINEIRGHLTGKRDRLRSLPGNAEIIQMLTSLGVTTTPKLLALPSRSACIEGGRDLSRCRVKR